MSERSGEEPQERAGHWWWGAGLFGAAVVLLLVAAAVSPLAGRVLGEEFGGVPWWVFLWPLAAVLVLAAGAGAGGACSGPRGSVSPVRWPEPSPTSAEPRNRLPPSPSSR
ncbi:hypothetical protein [Streptomyces diastaticus]|uniref:hypothetical protein n=1 Tax=Streptomyces diastaticus TaxID=1956 RepID=UPI0035E2FAA6